MIWFLNHIVIFEKQKLQMNLTKASLLIIVVLLIDQLSKIYVKTHFALGDSVEVFSWFKIHFVENEGMAWGKKIPGKYGKLFLSLFRIVAITGIGYWLWDSVRKKQHNLLIVSISLIFAGALGNVLDSIFYGVVFDHSSNQVATFMPEDGGYASVFYGKVVDMLYFPLYEGILPEWIPFWGGKYFTFFEPVFNVADSAICIAVIILLVFNKKVFPKGN